MNFLDFILTNKFEILEQTIEHIGLALTSLLISILIGIPLGIIITRLKKIKDFVIGFVGIIQTIPSIALLGFLIPFFGIGVIPAILALFLYALLPIVRSTCVGIEEVDSSVKEAANGMGMSDIQMLRKVELPLAVPVIFSGVRTAAVLNVAIATLCAYIAAGGLGEFIFRGIALSNKNMILAGAIPAALLAISFDFILGILQKYINKIIKPMLIVSCVVLFIIVPFVVAPQLFHHTFQAGFTAEFIEREDGYQGLKKVYNFSNLLKVKELESGLIFEALKSKQVNVISGHSTDGRIKAYHFQILKDDKHLFPPYYACPIIKGQTLRKYPALRNIFSRIQGKLTNEKMAQLNYRAEHNQELPENVARDFLLEAGLLPAKKNVMASLKPVQAEIIIGCKNFTEQFILAEIFKLLIENNTNLTVDLKKGLAGTTICFDALKKGEIDLYPEYTGTALFVILKPDKKLQDSLIEDKNKVYSYVKNECKKRFDIEWLPHLGFNNTWVLVMRGRDAEKLMIRTISDLKDDINRKT